MTTSTEKVAFATVKQGVRQRFDSMLAAETPLFIVHYDRDEIWEAYLQGFPEDDRQEHNCSSCRAFIRQAGPVVRIGGGPPGSNLKLSSIWPRDSQSPGVRALAEYVEARPINRPFYHDLRHVGTDKSPDPEKGIVWEHFFVEVPRALQNNKRNDLGRAAADLSESRRVMVRGFEEITDDAISLVLELIGQGSLYRGNEHQHIVEKFAAARIQYREERHYAENMSWLLVHELPDNVARCRNTAIGTLLTDLSTGTDLESAVRAFERMVAPANYKRPTALATPRMVEAAKKRLEELGMISALQRRRLDDRDLTAADATYVYRPTKSTKDVFEELTEEKPITLKELAKVETIYIADFLEQVVPTAKDMKVLVERRHLGNFVTLTGPQDPDAKNLMKWDNSFGWSYTGGVADSIKERVKKAGGDVNGWLRASLAWSNTDDLDLCFTCHDGNYREHVYYGHKQGTQAWLDVDMNVRGETREPVENITCNQQLKPGKYTIGVCQFRHRENQDTGYELEVEVDGEIHTFGRAKSPNQSQSDVVVFQVMEDGQVVFKDNPKMSKAGSGLMKWGVKTGVLTRVRALTLSPNHWTKPVGNKHFMFILEGCVSDEETRGFYNEFLTEKLSKERKTMEALASKVEVAPAQGAEMSGIGFSDTQRNHIYIQVDSTFKRILKVTF